MLNADSRDSLLFKALRLVRRFLLVKLCICMCLSAYYSMTVYQKRDLKATAYLALNYVNAANGLYPNGTRISIYDLIDDDILGMTLKRAGLESEMTTAELADLIVVQPRYVRTATQGFVSTEYRITINLKKPLKHVNARALAQLLCVSYADKFEQTYLSNAVLEDFKMCSLETYDYHEIALLYETKSAMLRDYLSRRRHENAIFRADATGETFKSLIDRLNTLSGVQLENYKAYVTRTGATRSRDTYESEYRYRLSNLDSEHTRALIDYAVRFEAILAYDPNQNNAVLIPSYDNTNAFYMSRTKTGIDDIALDAAAFAKTAQSISDNMLELQDRLSHMGSASHATILKAESLAESLKSAYNALLATAKQTDDAYIQYTSERIVSYSLASSALSTDFGLTKSLMLGAGAFAVLNVVQLLAELIFRRKKEDQYVRA